MKTDTENKNNKQVDMPKWCGYNEANTPWGCWSLI